MLHKLYDRPTISWVMVLLSVIITIAKCEVDPINSTETVLCSQCSNSNHYYVKIHIDSSELIGLNLQEVDLYSKGNLIAVRNLRFP